MTETLTYKDSGVDVSLKHSFLQEIAELLRRTHGPSVIDLPYGFAGLYSIEAKRHLFSPAHRKPVLVACTDGVGTKLKLAFMTGKHDTVGIDLVAMSVNDLVACGAEPLFFLDYLATGKLNPFVLRDVVKGISRGCLEGGCALLGGETAEMPDFYAAGEYDLAGFAVGIGERRKLIDGRRIRPGDLLVGLDSSGVHSNGYSLVRKVFFEKAKMKPGQYVPELGCTLGEELLRPTVIYARAVAAVLRPYRVKRVVCGIAHITGGAFYKNLLRLLPAHCVARIRKKSWEMPPIFRLIQKVGDVDEEEMYRVFNCGIGMILVVRPFFANRVLFELDKLGVGARVIGEIRKGERAVQIV